MIPHLTREFPDLTRAARVKTKAWRPKLKGMQTIQLLTTPRQAACKTSNLTRRTTHKTHGTQNASKARAHAALTPRAARHGARHASLRDRRDSGPRARSCDADLDGRRDEQNGTAHSLALDGVDQPSPRSRASRSVRRRGPLHTWRRRGVHRIDGVEGPRSLQNESRRWRVGGVEVHSRIRSIGTARRHSSQQQRAPRSG